MLKILEQNHTGLGGKPLLIELCWRRASIIQLLLVVSFVCVEQARALDPTNTVVGIQAGLSITTGTNDSGFGYHTFNQTTTGSFNPALGSSALQANTTGGYNTASARILLLIIRPETQMSPMELMLLEATQLDRLILQWVTPL